VKSVTMPMMSGPPNQPATPRMQPMSIPTAPPAIAPTPPPSRASSPPERARGHGLLAFGVFLGLVGAVGVTLTMAWYWRRAHPPPSEIARPPPTVDVVPDAAAPTPPPKPSDAPPPPPTGTATVPRKSGTH
jgi:hypothetical protein